MENIIKIENLSKSYNHFSAISNINLSVNRGTIFGLIGPNGSGKSTTIECILGTKKPDSGKISIFETNPLTSRKELFEKIGVQFQETNYQDKIKVIEICEATAALYQKPKNYIDLLTKFGINNKLKNFVSDLSGGQKQRLFIVLALIPNPEIIFLDELTTGLDTKARHDVWKILYNLKQNGLTIFLTSHFMDEIEILCDYICILKQGKIVFYGTVAEAIGTSPYNKLEDTYLWYTDTEAENNENL